MVPGSIQLSSVYTSDHFGSSLPLEYMTRSICMTAALITRGPPPPPFNPREHPQQQAYLLQVLLPLLERGKASLTPLFKEFLHFFHRQQQAQHSSLLGSTGYLPTSTNGSRRYRKPMSMKGHSQNPWTRSWANFHWFHFQFPKKKEYSTLAATADDDQPLEAEDSAGPDTRRSRNVVRALIAALVILAVLNLALLSTALRLYKDSHKAQGHAQLLDTPVPSCKQDYHACLSVSHNVYRGWLTWG